MTKYTIAEASKNALRDKTITTIAGKVATASTIFDSTFNINYQTRKST